MRACVCVRAYASLGECVHTCTCVLARLQVRVYCTYVHALTYASVHASEYVCARVRGSACVAARACCLYAHVRARPHERTGMRACLCMRAR